MPDPIIESVLAATESPEGVKPSTGDLGEERSLDDQGDGNEASRDRGSITSQDHRYGLGIETQNISDPARPVANGRFQRTLFEGFTEEPIIVNKDGTKEIVGEDPSGSSRTFWSYLKLWESEKEKTVRLQGQITDLKKKNQDMQRQTREAGTASEIHRKLITRYNNLVHDIESIRRENIQLRNDLSTLSGTNNKLNSLLKTADGENKRLSDGNEKLAKDNAALKGELDEERLYTKELKAKIDEQDEVIAKNHRDAINNLSQNVSSSVTDSQIAKELTSFFANCYEEWAMEHCVDNLEDTETIELDLLKGGLLWRDPSTPREFHFDLQDPTAPAIVLQTYLSQELWQLFFDNPYFLIALAGGKAIKAETSDGCGLSHIEHCEGQNGQYGMEWRMKTVERLELMYPLRKIQFRAMAESFCKSYSHLLKSPDENVIGDLEVIFSDCAELALRIWKTKKDIRVYGLDRFSADSRRSFMSSSPETKPDPAVQLAVRDPRLDGRPICLVVTPLICAYFRPDKAKAREQVVWSRATVWISNKTFELPQSRHRMDWSN